MTRQADRQTAPTVGLNLRAARDELELTQRQVAEAVGVTPADVSRWERGKVEPSARFRFPLAELLFDGDVSALYREPVEKAAA